MILNSDFVMPFGVNKGYTLAEIYQYLPSYIEWLIEYIPEFEIDLNEFEKLPNPTIHHNVIETKASSGEKITFQLRTTPIGSVEVIKNSKDLKEIKFEFPAKIKKILEDKRQGHYEPPEWIRPEYSETISILELFKNIKHFDTKPDQ